VTPRHVTLFKVAVIIALLTALGFIALSHSGADAFTATTYPVGTPSSTDVSGYNLPSAAAMPGYHQTYATTFSGSSLPASWNVYQTSPGGDPGAMFSPKAVTVTNNLLVLTASQDPIANPSTAGGNWITGGLCLCGVPGQVDGAYFYRSRVTGAGPDTIGLLWPDSNTWPPEIDFNESSGGTGGTKASVHFGTTDHLMYFNLSIDMMQWHTWGVIWAPSEIVFTVDGEVWAIDSDPSTIPTVSMHLSIQQQTFCGATPAHACPTTDQSTQVDWVAQYAPDSSVGVTSTTGAAPTTSSTTTTSAPLSALTIWGDTSVASSMNAASTTDVNFPSLSSLTGGELYVGYGYASGHALSTSSAGTTFDATGAGSGLFAFNPDVAGALGPVGAQMTPGTSATIAAMVSAEGIAGAGIEPVGSLQQGGGNASSDALELSPQATGDAFVVAVRMASSSDAVASISGGGATWTPLTSLRDASDDQELELWLGTIADTDLAPVIVTPRTIDVATDIVVQEFRDAAPAPTTTTPTTIPTTSTPTTEVSNTTPTTTIPTATIAPSTPPVTTATTTTAVPTTTKASNTTSTTTSSPTAVVPTSTPHRPGVPRLLSAHISGTQAWVKWTDTGGRVTRVSAAVYVGANCQVVVHTQVVPNTVDSVAHGEIHFSSARGGVAKVGSFSPTRTYSVRINSVVGPGGANGESRCLTLGRG
jgi:hypothetical protein